MCIFVFQYVRVFRRSGLQGPGFMASGLHEATGAQSLFCGLLTVVLLEPFVKARAAAGKFSLKSTLRARQYTRQVIPFPKP